MTRVCVGCGKPCPPQEGRAGQPRKWCSAECCRDTYNANRRRGRATLAERLASKLIPDGDCLVYSGSKNEAGYGTIKVRGRSQLAHRVAWEQEEGPIPEGMQVLHTCDNPPCCLIEHLWLGTHEDNMADRDRKGRTLRGADLRLARWGR